MTDNLMCFLNSFSYIIYKTKVYFFVMHINIGFPTVREFN